MISSTATTSVAHGISNIDWIVDFTAMMKHSVSVFSQFSFNSATSGAAIGGITIDDININMRLTTALPIVGSYVTILYTKT